MRFAVAGSNENAPGAGANQGLSAFLAEQGGASEQRGARTEGIHAKGMIGHPNTSGSVRP
jgi:hypothetical protein